MTLFDTIWSVKRSSRPVRRAAEKELAEMAAYAPLMVSGLGEYAFESTPYQGAAFDGTYAPMGMHEGRPSYQLPPPTPFRQN